MNEEEYDFLRGERHTLQRRIAETPPGDVIDLLSLRARLAEVDEQITAAEAGPIGRDPARARLTFSGRPVVGQHGIIADFGTKAVNGFVEAVTAIAASLSGPLAPVGRIPHREQNQLLITNVALGSFGFEFEEHRPEGAAAVVEPSTVELALDRAADLLLGTLVEGDDQLADAAAELDQRAVDRVRDFVGLLADNGAICTLATREKLFRFADLAQVARSRDRLSPDNLHEDTRELEVEFLGALPHRRTFEFRLPSSDEVLSGRSGRSLPPLDPLNDHRRVLVRAQFQVTQVGEGKPRYKLLALPDWPPAAP